MLRLVTCATLAFAVAAIAQERGIPLSELKSGIAYAGADVRAMQADDEANPAMLWVQRGEALWREGCAACHGEAPASMRGVAARYPAYDANAQAVVDLDGRIERCRTGNAKAAPFGRESESLLALSAYVSYQSRGLPLQVTIDGPARAAFDRGEAFYRQRHGQMNLACTQCHDRNYGKRLYTETLSQGHPTAFPAYRLEWQGVGSLSRRIRACLFGVRAQMPAPGAPELADVELYLAWRAQGLPLEAPGVRR
ncbi:MAG: sulfur oxidation c-type cytochrome SoxA [Burkholderiales bacterium]|nr:sulfur oxidation c-type cytochrome SoxA [Burkholderiales bacterium]